MEKGPKGAEATLDRKIGGRFIPRDERRIWSRAIRKEGGRILQVIGEGQLCKIQETHSSEEGLVEKTLYREVPVGHLGILIEQPLDMNSVFERVFRSRNRRRILFGDSSS